MAGLSGSLAPFRKRIVGLVFKAFDALDAGTIALADLRKVYNDEGLLSFGLPVRVFIQRMPGRGVHGSGE